MPSTINIIPLLEQVAGFIGGITGQLAEVLRFVNAFTKSEDRKEMEDMMKESSSVLDQIMGKDGVPVFPWSEDKDIGLGSVGGPERRRG